MNEYLSPVELSLALVDSIRSIDARLDELYSIIAQSPVPNPDDRRLRVLSRTKALVETRGKLCESLQSIGVL